MPPDSLPDGLVGWVGVDPGKSGAIAAILPRDEILLSDMPQTPQELAEFFRHFAEGTRITVERAQAMPKQGVVSMFNYGEQFGEILGVLAALRLPYRLVTPAVWKREMGLIGKDKVESRRLAEALFPTVQLSRMKDHGMAEALLIAEWGRRKGSAA